MCLKSILKVIISFLIFLSLANSSFATSRILKGEFLSLETTLYILSQINNNKKIISIDLRNCDIMESYNIDKTIRDIIISEYINSYIIAGGDKLYIYNRQNGKVAYAFNDFSRNVTIIRQSHMGEYIVASDGSTFSLYQFKKEGLVKIYSKEILSGIYDIYLDIESNLLYVVEKTGIVSLWSFSGKLQRNIKIDNIITSLIYDSKTGYLLAGAPNGLFKISKDDFQMEKVLSGKILSLFIENNSSRLEMITSAGLAVYDYPFTKKPIFSLNGANGNIIKKDGGNFTAFSSLNFIKIYDLKTSMHIATLAVDNLGIVNFYPPEANYGSNVSASFISATARSSDSAPQYNKDRVCAPIAAMVYGIYSPTGLNIGDVNIKYIDEVYDVATPSIKEVDPIHIPEVTFNGADINEPIIADVPQVADVEINSHISQAKNPNNVITPNEPKVDDIQELVPTQVPNWVANRKNLPKNNSVGSGKSEKEAKGTALSQLKNGLVRQVLADLLKEESISKIENIDGKKRILWQAAAKTINSPENKVHVADIWVSPAGQYFIHLVMDDKSIQNKAKKYLEEEIKKYNATTFDDYMQEKAESLE